MIIIPNKRVVFSGGDTRIKLQVARTKTSTFIPVAAVEIAVCESHYRNLSRWSYQINQ